MKCDFCSHKNSWDCEDSFYRHSNCEYFKLHWNSLSDEAKRKIMRILDELDTD